MTTRQYGRECKLSVINTDGTTTSIEGLRIQFEVTKSNKSWPNLADIKLFNLSEDTTTYLLQDKTKIQLEVGYDGTLSTIFKGEIASVIRYKSNVDSILHVLCADGSKDWKDAYFSKTYSEQVSVKRVIEDVLNSFSEVTTGVISGLPDVADKILGQSISEPSKDVMDKYAKEYGFDWSIQDEEIVVLQKRETNPASNVVVVNSTTGLLGSPNITEIGADIITLLNPLLLPNTKFTLESVGSSVELGNMFFRKVKSTYVSGDFKVLEVKFVGDNYEGDWQSKVVGISI